MISLIVCSRRDPSDTLHERNARATASGPVEYIRIDNQNNRYGICAAYNEGVCRATGDLLAFMHEDAYFMERGWDTALEKKFSDETLGMAGIAGTQYLRSDPPGWVAAGRPFIKGRIIHETDNGNTFHLTVFSWDKTDAEAVAVDGVFFTVRRDLFNTARFDDKTFDGFHFYDLDLCMQVRRTRRIVVTPDILIKHSSGGSFDAAWKKYADRFVEKYKDELPASCTEGIPDLSRRVPFETFDLKGIIPQVTIA